MRKELIQTGETVDKAIESACMLLGVDPAECEFEILNLPKSSFFGLVKTPGKVRVWVEVEETPEEVAEKAAETIKKVMEEKKASAPPVKQPAAVKVPSQIKAAPVKKAAIPASPARELDHLDQEKVTVATAFVIEIMKNMDLDAEITSRVEGDIITIAIEGKGLGAVIGRRGETLNALQYLTGLVANRLEGEYLRINVDAGDYRLKRNETLLEMTKRGVEEVRRTDISQALEPMNPAERRTVHSAVAEYEGVSSASVGSEPYRRVVIKTPTSKSPRDNRRGSSGSREGGGSRDTNRDRNRPRGSYKERSASPKPVNEKKHEAKVDTAPVAVPPPTPEKGDTPLYGKIDFD